MCFEVGRLHLLCFQRIARSQLLAGKILKQKMTNGHVQQSHHHDEVRRLWWIDKNIAVEHLKGFKLFSVWRKMTFFTIFYHILQERSFTIIFSSLFTVIIAMLLAKNCHIEINGWCDNSTGLAGPRLKCELNTGLELETNSNSTLDEAFQALRNGSSVYCIGQTKKERTCRFQNLCFSSKFEKYLFFHGPATFQEGLPERRFDPALLDLSSIDDHNTQYFNYVDFPASSIGVDFHDIKFITKQSVLFHRFNPDNFMHVIHDDLLPLWLTNRLFFVPIQQAKVQLVMMDGRDKGPWFQLYQFISPHFHLKTDIMKNGLTCFKELVVGLSKETTWYQYGFKVPQGPIANYKANKIHLSLFADEVLSHFDCKENVKKYVILISRKQTRCILNQLEVSITLANFFKREVAFLDFETQSLNRAICLMRQAVALVGMHGAELTLALFLQPGSSVVELFPYGINPDQYTPYKTLANILGLQYVAWNNIYPENTRGYPDRLPKLGGISQLPESLQEKILSSEEIPDHLCCDDPFWLYRIYQDTVVDLNSLQLALSKLESNRVWENSSNHDFLYPDAAQEPSCLIQKEENNIWRLQITWKPPVNEKYIQEEHIKYQVVVQKDDDVDVSAYELNNTELVLKNGEFKSKYKVWIRCKLKDIVGPLSATINCL